MAHARKQIRDNAMVDLSGLTTTGTRVYNDRPYPIDQTQLPALFVFITDETAEVISMMGADNTLQRTATFTVVGLADGAGLDDTLDLIAKEVEAAMYSANTFQGVAKGRAEYQGMNMDIAEGDSRTGSITMRWRIVYLTSSSDAETPL